jgi:hypothetical protein
MYKEKDVKNYFFLIYKMAVNKKNIFFLFKPKPTRENSIMVIQKASNFMFLVQV